MLFFFSTIGWNSGIIPQSWSQYDGKNHKVQSERFLSNVWKHIWLRNGCEQTVKQHPLQVHKLVTKHLWAIYILILSLLLHGDPDVSEPLKLPLCLPRVTITILGVTLET